jgi:hypothetical protein
LLDEIVVVEELLVEEEVAVLMALLALDAGNAHQDILL